MDIVFLTFAAWAFWNEAYWAFVGAVILLQFSSNFAGPYQGYIPDLVPGRQVGVASGMLGAANIAGNLLGPGLAICSWPSCPRCSATRRSRWACSW